MNSCRTAYCGSSCIGIPVIGQLQDVTRHPQLVEPKPENLQPPSGASTGALPRRQRLCLAQLSLAPGDVERAAEYNGAPDPGEQVRHLREEDHAEEGRPHKLQEVEG